MPTKRFTGAAAVSRDGVSAGTIESSNGSASVTPAPRRNVRRGCASWQQTWSLHQAPGPQNRTRPTTGLRPTSVLLSRIWNCGLFTTPARWPRIGCRPSPRRARWPDRRHVGVLHATADRVGHQLLDEHPHELRRIAHQRRPQPRRTVHVLPSNSVTFESIGMPPSPPCFVRQLASASRFSSANPIGSMMAWHPAHGGFARWMRHLLAQRQRLAVRRSSCLRAREHSAAARAAASRGCSRAPTHRA